MTPRQKRELSSAAVAGRCCLLLVVVIGGLDPAPCGLAPFAEHVPPIIGAMVTCCVVLALLPPVKPDA